MATTKPTPEAAPAPAAAPPRESINDAIAAIMAEVPGITKGRQNDSQHYKFRGIDDVYNALNPILARHGVFMRAEILELKREERPSRSGGVMAFVQVKVRYFFCARDGSSVYTDSLGEGMDSGDKATPKAMSIAQKYALLQMFLIPTEDLKDSEAGEQVEQGGRPKPPATQPPPSGKPPAAPKPAPPAAAPPATPKAAPPKGKPALEPEDPQLKEALIDVINRAIEAAGISRQAFLGWLASIQGEAKRRYVGKKFDNWSLHEGKQQDIALLAFPTTLQRAIGTFVSLQAEKAKAGAGPDEEEQAEAPDAPEDEQAGA